MAKNLLVENGLEWHFRTITPGDVPQAVDSLSPSERAQLSDIVDEAKDDNALSYELDSTLEVALAVRSYWAS